MPASKWPATTVHVYDAVKTRMTEALQIARQYVTLDFRGVFIEPLLLEASSGEDTADIVANMFLDQISEEQMWGVGYGFLEHRECKLCHTLKVYLT
jgi:hypothetical protein